MQLHLKAPDLALEPGQVLTLDDAEGMRILAHRGTVWVTEEGDAKDHIVEPGDALIVAHSGRTLVQALKPALISIGECACAANDPSEGDPMTACAQSAWYADGLRWIASLISGAADHLDRVSFAPPEPGPPNHELPREMLPREDWLDDIRHRIQNRYY